MDTDYRWRQNVFACFDSADSSKQQIAKAYPIVSVRRLNLSFWKIAFSAVFIYFGIVSAMGKLICSS